LQVLLEKRRKAEAEEEAAKMKAEQEAKAAEEEAQRKAFWKAFWQGPSRSRSIAERVKAVFVEFDLLEDAEEPAPTQNPGSNKEEAEKKAEAEEGIFSADQQSIAERVKAVFVEFLSMS